MLERFCVNQTEEIGNGYKCRLNLGESGSRDICPYTQEHIIYLGEQYIVEKKVNGRTLTCGDFQIS